MDKKRLAGIVLLVLLILAILISVSIFGGDDTDTEKKTIEGVSFADKTVVFDGTEQKITLTGTLPEGVSVSYEGNRGTDAGQYSATATLTGEGYETLILKAKLTIEKKTIEGVTLASQTFTYDGTVKSLSLSGALPEGVTASWTGNGATDAGNHSVKVTLNGKNYKDLTLSAIIVIEKTDITGITLAGGEFTYDGEEKKLEIAGTLPEGVSVSYSGNVQTEVGEYPVTATLTGDNYNTLTLPAVLIIKRAEITGITFPGGEFIYDGEEKKLEILGELPLGVTVSYSGNVATEAGIYEAVATLSGDNYKEFTLRATLVITAPASDEDIEGVTLGGASFIYDGTVKSLSLSGALPEGVTVSWVGNSATDAGEHQVTAILSGEGYNTLTLRATLIIKKADITGITLAGGEFTYDGEEKELEIAGTLPEGVSISYSGNVQKNAGEYPVVATLSGDNYNTLTLEATLIIKRAEITGITFPGGEFIYDGEEKKLEILGELPLGVTVSYSGNVATEAGIYEAVATLSGDNYKELTLRATLVITAPAIDEDIEGVTLGGASFIYDGTSKSLSLSGALPEGVTVSWVGNSATDAGEHQVTAILSGEGYNTLTLRATLIIKKAEITGITLAGGEFTYDGTAKSLSLSGTPPTGVSVSFSGNGQTAAGEHQVTATLSGDNYNTLTLKATLTILPAEITGVTLDSASFTYDGTAKSLSLSGALPTGVDVSFSGNEQTAVGSHQVTATISGDNYNTLTLKATLTIVAADITGVRLESAEYTYDGKPKSLKLSAEVPEGVTITFAGNGKTNAGEYKVVAVLSGEGYNTLTLEATLKINKASLSGALTLASKEVNYEKGKTHSLVVEGEIPDGVTVTYSNENIEYAGIYTITVVIEGENYERLVLTATLTIKGVGGSGFTTPEHKW